MPNFPSYLLSKTLYRFSPFPQACHITHPAQPHWYDQPQIFQGVQNISMFLTKFSPSSCFFPHGFRCVCEHPTLRTFNLCPSVTEKMKISRSSIHLRLMKFTIEIFVYLRPAISTQVFLGFPLSISKCWDGSQHSKLLLHASHVTLQT